MHWERLEFSEHLCPIVILFSEPTPFSALVSSVLELCVFIKNLLCMRYVCRGHSMCVEIRGQWCGVYSLSFKWVLGLESGLWVCMWKVFVLHHLTSPSSRACNRIKDVCTCVHVPASPCRLYVDRENVLSLTSPTA